MKQIKSFLFKNGHKRYVVGGFCAIVLVIVIVAVVVSGSVKTKNGRSTQFMMQFPMTTTTPPPHAFEVVQPSTPVQVSSGSSSVIDPKAGASGK